MIASTECEVMGGAMLAPVVEEFMNGLIDLYPAIGITDVQYVTGNDFTNGINQLKGVTCIELAYIQ